MKFPFLSNAKNNIVQHPKFSWQWSSCHQPRTLSFRTDNNTIFKTINSAYLDFITEADKTPQSLFSNTSQSASFSSDNIPLETVIRGLRSDRLFFEPGETSSIMEEAIKASKDDDGIDGVPFKESVVLSMESRDPYVDFRESMEEMVEAHGLKDWEGLEQLLCWYLRANGKSNHGYIVGAFVDLLVGRQVAINYNSKSNSCIPNSCSNCSPSSPLSFCTSSPSSSYAEDCSSTTIPCVSSLEAEKEINDNNPCLSSSLLETDLKKEMIIIKGNEDDDASSSLLDV